MASLRNGILPALLAGALVVGSCSTSKSSTATDATTTTVPATTTIAATTTISATTTTAAATTTAPATTTKATTPVTNPPGPRVSASFSGPDCATDLDPTVTVSWEISAGADVMYIAVDDVNGKYDDIPATGSITFTFACDGTEHNYYVVAEKDGIRKVKSKGFTG